MTQTILTLLKAILKVALVSSAFALLAHYTKQSVLMWFATTFVIQFIGFYLYGEYQEYRLAKDTAVLRLKELDILAKITFNVPCAACKQMNEVVINAQEDTVFTCVNCQVKNAVYVNVEAAIVTQPLNNNVTPL